AYLKRIERGEATLPAFLSDIERYVREVVGKAGEQRQDGRRQGERAEDPGGNGNGRSASPRGTATAPPIERRDFSAHAGNLDDLLHAAFGFATFRPAARSLRSGGGRERRAAGDAHGRRKIVVLPI